MPEITQTEEINVKQNPETCLCTNFEGSKNFNNKTVSKNNNEIKECPQDLFTRNCPRIEPRPGDPSEDKQTEKSAGFTCPPIPRVLPSPPLGPMSKTVSLDYWTPLAERSGAQAKVDKYSISRYVPQERELHYETLLKESNKNVQDASLTVFNALCSMEKAFVDTDRETLYNDIRLSARIGVVFRWKVELERDIADLACEIGLIQEEKIRLQRCIHALDLVESINKEIKQVRCSRMEPDLVRDQVEEEVIEEGILCGDIRNVYNRCVDHINQQLKELKEAKQRLEYDWSGKKATYEIDTTCRGLKNNSPNILWEPGSVRIPEGESTPLNYEQFSKESILQSQNALQKSRTLRMNMKNIYESSARDLQAQADRVDMALEDNIEQTYKTCCKLESELSRCLKSLSETEALIEKIDNAVIKLDGAMKCTQTRLHNRLHREGVENCRDIPHFGLIDEAKSISENVTAVLAQKKRAEELISKLIKSRKDVEVEIITKRKSLYVDRERCQPIRTSYPSVQNLTGY